MPRKVKDDETNTSNEINVDKKVVKSKTVKVTKPKEEEKISSSNDVDKNNSDNETKVTPKEKKNKEPQLFVVAPDSFVSKKPSL